MAQSGSVAADRSAGLWQDSPSQGAASTESGQPTGLPQSPGHGRGAPGWGQFQARAAIGGAQGPVPAAGPLSPGGEALRGSLCRAARTAEHSAEGRCGSRQDQGGGGAAGTGQGRGRGRGGAGVRRGRGRGGAAGSRGGALGSRAEPPGARSCLTQPSAARGPAPYWPACPSSRCPRILTSPSTTCPTASFPPQAT